VSYYLVGFLFVFCHVTMSTRIFFYKSQLANDDLHYRCPSGLPDGLFSNQKSQFGKILKVLAMVESGIFLGHSVNFEAIWYSLFPFGTYI
jgi:hypothetical protein